MKTGSRLFAVLLALIFTFGQFPVANAASQTVRISSAEDLAALADNCVLDSWSKGLTVILDNDVDLSGTDFKPIPVFGGRFCGNGHTISGISIEGAIGSAGFIRTVLTGAVVEDLHVSGNIAPSKEASSAGGIAAVNYGTIKDCSFDGSVVCKTSVGGVAGINTETGVIVACSSTGSIEGEHGVGGIAGSNRGVIRNCESNAVVNNDITETERNVDIDADELLSRLMELRLSAEEYVDITDVGGVAGVSSGVLRGCKNHGTVGHANIGYNVGGVVGRLSGYAEDCENDGLVYGRKDVGGIAGQIDPYTEWSVSNDMLNGLRERVDGLSSAVSAFSDDVGVTGSRLSSDLSDVLYYLNEANTALDVLSGEAIDFTNANIETLKELSDRVTEALRLLSPVLNELSGFTGELPGIFEKLSQAIADLREAGVLAGDTNSAVTGDIAEAETIINGIVSGLEGIMEMLREFAQAPEDHDVGNVIAAIEGFITTTRASLERLVQLIADIRSALTGLDEVGENIDNALEALQEASDMAASASEALDRAERLLTEAVDALSRYDAILFVPINDDTDSRRKLFSAIGETYAAMQRISQGLGDSELSDELTEISESFFDLVDFTLDALEGVKLEGEKVIENDPDNSDWTGNGSLRSCANSGSVFAETNAGGIAGAITLDFEFDLEDQFRLSYFVSGKAKYVVHSSIAGCTNGGVITTRANCSGGIVGRMDFGALKDCASSGAINADAYAGGIAGRSEGTILGCMTRVSVSADSYCGGIAGHAHIMKDCLTIPVLTGHASFEGSVAGYADEQVTGCFYSESDVGGIDGASYSGAAERIDYEGIIERIGNPELFKTVNVTFIKDDTIVKTVSVPYGDSLAELPHIEDLDGKHWKWNIPETSALRADLWIDGAYVSPIYVLATDEQTPECLAEGEFDESQRLELREYAFDGDLPGARKDRILKTGTVLVNDYSGPLTVHILADGKGALYTCDPNGELAKTDYTVDGSYIVFTLQNGGSFVYAKQGPDPLPFIIGGAVTALLAAGIAILATRSKRRGRP